MRPMRSIIVLGTLLTAVIAIARAQTPTTQPSAAAGAPSSVQLRAQEEFARGNWAAALPLLKKAAAELRDQPDRLGPIEEGIRVCEKNLKLAADTTTVASAASAPGGQSAKRTPHAAPKPGEVLTMEIKDLGNFDYDADNGGNIPDDVKRLSGATLRLKGFMIPMDQADKITQFALVPSLFACCYGQPPQVQHTILVHAPAGKAVSYYPDEILVEGKLLVEEKKEDGFIVSVFELACTSVKPAAK